MSTDKFYVQYFLRQSDADVKIAEFACADAAHAARLIQQQLEQYPADRCRFEVRPA